MSGTWVQIWRVLFRIRLGRERSKKFDVKPTTDFLRSCLCLLLGAYAHVYISVCAYNHANTHFYTHVHLQAVNRQSVMGQDDVAIIERLRAAQRQHGAVRMTIKLPSTVLRPA